MRNFHTAMRAFALAALLMLALPGCSTDSASERTRHALATIYEADRLYNLGDVAQGRDWLKKAIALSTAEEVYIGSEDQEEKGVVFVARMHGDDETLASLLSQAVKDPKLAASPDIQGAYGDVLFELGRIPESRSAYASQLAAIVKLYPSLSARTPLGRPALLAKAEAEWRSGDHAAGDKDFDAVCRLYPDFADEATNNRAFFAAEEGTDLVNAEKRSLAAVAAAGKADKEDVLAVYEDTLGWVYYKMYLADHSKAHLDKAVSYLELAVTGFPEEPELHSHLAQAYDAAGRTADAAIEYMRLASMWPANQKAQETAKRLAAEAGLPFPSATAPAQPTGGESAAKA